MSSTTPGITIFVILFFLAYYVYMSFCVYRIAQKTNTPDAWFSWIPILNIILTIRIAKKPAWWIFWFIIPLANIIAYVLVWMGILRTLRKREWLGILMIISPFNLLIPGYLAFSGSIKARQSIQIVNVSL